MTRAELEARFTYHPPNEEQRVVFVEIRERAIEFATFIDQACPESREQSLAMTKLEECVMWANAGVSRRWPKEGGDQ